MSNFCPLIYSNTFILHSIQFQSFVQFRGKLKSRSTDEIQQLKDNPKAWNIHSMLNVLYSLVEKSNINKQVFLGSESESEDIDGESEGRIFGSHK